jgi:hypothetical protein
MSKNLSTPTPATGTADTESMQAGVSGLASDAMARRRMLLKSLGKGSSVIAAAALPMHTLAGTGTLAKTINKTRCTVSSMASAVHSKNPTDEICTGSPPTHYNDCSKWPSCSSSTITKRDGTKVTTYTVSHKDINSFTDSSTFYSVFGCGGNSSIKTIMTTSTSSDEAAWITALFNSMIGTTGTTTTGVKNYPYKPSEVISLCKNQPSSLIFFKNNLQQVVI